MLPDSPTGISGVLDAGIRLYRARFRHWTLIALSILAGFALLRILLASTLGSGSVLEDAGTATPDMAMATTALAGSLLSMLGSLWAYAAMVRAIMAEVGGAPLSLGDAVRGGLGRLLPMLLVWLLYFLVVGIGLVLLLVPGIWLGTSLILGTVLCAAGTGPIQSLQESFRLVKGHWWTTATVVFVISLIIMVLALAISLVPGILIGVAAASGAGTVPGWLSSVGIVLEALTNALIVPLSVCMSWALLHDLRLRHSGDDLEARLDATLGA